MGHIKSSGQINFVQLFMMFSLMNGLASHVIVNPMVLDASGRDSWLTALVSGGLFLIWIALLGWLMRRSGQEPWMDWLSARISRPFAFLLVLPVAIQLYLIGGMTVVHTATWHITNYLPFTPKLLIAGSLVLFCMAICLWGLGVIAVVSGVLLPIVVALGIFVSAFNSPMKDYSLLQPVLEHGFSPVVDGMVYTGAGSVELLAVILLQHRLKKKVKIWQLLLYGLFSTLISMGPLMAAVTEFGPAEAAHQMTSPYEQWRLVQIGRYIEHLDFLSIFQWLSGACIRISLSVYLLVDLFRFRKKKVRNWAVIAVMTTYGLASMIPINEYDVYRWMSLYYMPISLAVLLPLSFVWMFVALFSRGRKRKEESM
ncbi:endospore germination permease [Paenibacillus sp. LHD-117]|uniref:GerAB/ArcD/ProY family transporter n=1 Tax=Paenibacillus sp. LHD-117 TaxID=3071412 RepID=UPI0027DEB228|nr:endospore germination permease [Paenibacillus sp. LHD-117]MDQ6419441.1 endospore germination permease [Paenibacillus sp. LHD-117]